MKKLINLPYDEMILAIANIIAYDVENKIKLAVEEGDYISDIDSDSMVNEGIDYWFKTLTKHYEEIAEKILFEKLKDNDFKNILRTTIYDNFIINSNDAIWELLEK